MRDPDDWKPMWVWYHTALLLGIVVADVLLALILGVMLGDRL